MLRLYKLLIQIKLFLKSRIFLKFIKILNKPTLFFKKVVFFLFGTKVYDKLGFFYNNIRLINFYKLNRYFKKKKLELKLKKEISKLLYSLQNQNFRFIPKQLDIYEKDTIKKLNVLSKNQYQLLFDYNFNFLGGNFYNYKKGNNFNWNLDPINNKSFENNKDFETQQNNFFKNTEIKYSWELSRLHQVFVTSILYFQTGKDDFLKFYRSQIEDFIDNNKPGRSIAWNNAMECSIRSINLISSFEFINLNLHDIALQNKMINFLKENLKFIINNLEYSYSVNSNHYLFNIFGLIYLSNFFNEEEILSISSKELYNEINSQFYNDGGNFENSFNYHRFNLEGILHCLHILKLRQIKIPNNIQKKIKSSLDFLITITTSDGNFPNIGDTDNGRLLVYEDYFKYFEKNNTFHLINAFSNYFFKETFNFSKLIKNKNYRIFKNENFIDNITESKTEKFFKESGMYIYKEKNNFFCVTNSKVGTGGIGNHKHNDNFSFYLSIDNEEIFVDPGSYHYASDLNKRFHYRSIFNHNSFQKIGEEPNNLDINRPWNMKEDSNIKNFVTLGETYSKISLYRSYLNKSKRSFYERVFEIDKKNFNLFFEDKIHSNYDGDLNWSFFLGHKVLLKKENNLIEIHTNKKNFKFLYDIKLNCKIEDVEIYPCFGKSLKSKKIIFNIKNKRLKSEKYKFEIKDFF